MARASANERLSKLDARRDSADFRDLMYQPALVQVRKEVLPDPKLMHIRDQGQEGACTGFGLAAVIDYLNQLRVAEQIIPRFEPVSTRMLYEQAKQHDQWPGEAYSGSSARGAMKGWHKRGVCTEQSWRYEASKPGHLTPERRQEALRYPLGAYYRVQSNRVDLQVALNEVPALYASAHVHDGWFAVRNGRIPVKAPTDAGHAFAILGYTDDGFIVQNSWGKGWSTLKLGGREYPGAAIWAYEDAAEGLMDVWVARMGLAGRTDGGGSARAIVHGPSGPTRKEQGPAPVEVAGHYVHVDDGLFSTGSDYPSSALEARDIIDEAVTGPAKHIVFYAHGGLNTVEGAANRVAAWRKAFDRNEVYEIHFIWETGFLEELKDVLSRKHAQVEQRVGASSDWWDPLVEKVAHRIGHDVWMEMLADARAAFQPLSPRANPAGTVVLNLLQKALTAAGAPAKKLHLVGHSAGSIWIGELLSRWRALIRNSPAADRLSFENLVLFAPACTHAFAAEHLVPALQGNAPAVKRLTHLLLSDRLEQEDSVAVYGKSLLYLVSNSFQKPRSELNGPHVPIMGMERFWPGLKETFAPVSNRVQHYVSDKHPGATNSQTHGGFDNDLVSMRMMLLRVLARKSPKTFAPEELTGY